MSVVLGETPVINRSGWREVTLGEVVEQRGERVRPQDYPHSPLLGLEHVAPRSMRIIGHGIGADAKSTVGRFTDTDVLYGRLRPYLNKVVRPGFSGLCSAEFIVLTAGADIDPNFLRLRIFCPDFVAFTGILDAGDRPRVKFGQISEFEFMLPPLDEQKRIVEIVEALMAQIADGERHLQSAINAADKYRAAVLRDALSGEWPSVNLGSSLMDLRYGTSKKSTYDGIGTPVLRIPNISGGVVSTGDLKFAELTRAEVDTLELRAGDVLIIRSNGSVGLVGRGARVVDEGQGMAYAGYLIRLRTDPGVLRSEFLELALAAPQLRIQIERHARSTSGVHNINSDEVRRLSLPLPPLEEQDQIVQRCRDQLAASAALSRTVHSQSAEADRLRQAILRDAMAGKLTNQEQT